MTATTVSSAYLLNALIVIATPKKMKMKN
jgi:hypothetical protein